MFNKNKKAIIITDYLGWIIIAILFLVIGFLMYSALSGNNTSTSNFLQNLFRLRRA